MTAKQPLAFSRPEAIPLYNAGCKAMEEGAYAEAVSYFRRTVLVEPESLMARYNLGFALQRAGDLSGSIEVFRKCLSAHPDDLDSAYNLGILLAEQGRYGEADAILGDLHRRYPGENKVVQNLAQVRWRRRMAEAVEAERGLGLRRVLIAAMPKSASTFLADVIARLPGMQRAHLVPDYGRREQELDLEQLVNHQGLSYVTQLHLRPSKLTLELVEAFGLRPVFLFRDIWDVMASLRDHMHRNSMDWSMARVEEDFRRWDEARQYEFLARAMMPWFIDFYVSWWKTEDKLTVRYEELMADPEATVARIAAWAGIAASPAEAAAAIAATGHSATFNKGGSGRGKAVPETARAHVQALAAFYPGVDFAPLLSA